MNQISMSVRPSAPSRLPDEMIAPLAAMGEQGMATVRDLYRARQSLEIAGLLPGDAEVSAQRLAVEVTAATARRLATLAQAAPVDETLVRRVADPDFAPSRYQLCFLALYLLCAALAIVGSSVVLGRYIQEGPLDSLASSSLLALVPYAAVMLIGSATLKALTSVLSREKQKLACIVVGAVGLLSLLVWILCASFVFAPQSVDLSAVLAGKTPPMPSEIWTHAILISHLVSDVTLGASMMMAVTLTLDSCRSRVVRTTAKFETLNRIASEALRTNHLGARELDRMQERTEFEAGMAFADAMAVSHYHDLRARFDAAAANAKVEVLNEARRRQDDD